MPIYQHTYGTGKPIVLVHGWAMHSGIWQDFALQLAEHYQVTCIDLPGHGHSASLTEFSLTAIGDALVNAISEPQSCWLGWSLGATVVLDIAQRYPERVSSLVLLAGNPAFTQSAEWPGMKTELLDRFAEQLFSDSLGTLQRFLSLQVHNLANAKALQLTLQVALSACPAPDLSSLQAGLTILKQSDLRPALANTHCLTAVVLGTRDTLVPVSVGAAMQTLASQIHLTIIDKAGHVPFLSHPDEVITAINQLMKIHALR